VRLTYLIKLAYSTQSKSTKLYTILKWVLRSIFSQRVLIKNSVDYSSNTITVAQQLKRSDLKSTPIEASVKLAVDYYIISHRLQFNAGTLLKILKWIIACKCRPNRSFLLFSILELDAIYENLKRKDLSNVTNCIFHNEKQYWEGLYCIAFNRLGLNTLSVFHGFSRDTGRKITAENVNPINYLDQLAKNQLCWGEVHLETIKKYANTDIRHYVVGKDKLPIPRDTCSRNGSSLEKNLIVLDSSLLKDTNSKLIMIASTLPEYGVKAHPDDEAIYQNEVGRIEDVIERGTVVWGCNSSAVLQLGRSGLDVNLLFESDFLDDIKDIYKEKDPRGYVKIRNYDWSDFISCYGDEYYARIRKILTLKNK